MQHVRPPDTAEATRTRTAHGDILISITGDTGMVGVVPPDLGEAYINQHIALARPALLESAEYLAIAFMSPMGLSQLWDRQRGIKNSLGLDDIRTAAIPVPPLAEQRRIVARVDELMGLLDDLERTQDRRERTRVAARHSTLDALRSAASPEEVDAAWERFAERVDEMICGTEDVEPLRHLVLELALRGRLVPQDPNDEPVSTLLERVATARSANPAVHPSHTSASNPRPEPMGPHPIPASWRWVFFAQITEARLGKMLDKANNTGHLRPYLRNANVQWYRFDTEHIKELRIEDAQLDDCTVRIGDLVVCEGGEPGRSAVCDQSIEGMVIQKALHRVRPIADISSWYLAHVLRAASSDGRLAEHFTGATIKHLTGRSLASVLVPLPPAAEQYRIVARVSELMDVLDRLEARLVSERSAQTAFAAAAVHHLDA
ncbi:MAG: restriction endonuclease subunit S [Planctomycetes bacterium]|nr:restriction endonuclease subunit S [Planctomycetota bacterium]